MGSFPIIYLVNAIYIIVIIISSVIAAKMARIKTTKFNQEAYIAITILTGVVVILLSMIAQNRILKSKKKILVVSFIPVCLFIAYNVQSYSVIKNLDPNDSLKRLCITNLIFICFLLFLTFFTFFKNFSPLLSQRYIDSSAVEDISQKSDDGSAVEDISQKSDDGSAVEESDDDSAVEESDDDSAVKESDDDSAVKESDGGSAVEESDDDSAVKESDVGIAVEDISRISDVGIAVEDISQKNDGSAVEDISRISDVGSAVEESEESDVGSAVEESEESEESDEYGTLMNYVYDENSCHDRNPGMEMIKTSILDRNNTLPDSFENDVDVFVSQKNKTINSKSFNDAAECFHMLDELQFLVKANNYKKSYVENQPDVLKTSACERVEELLKSIKDVKLKLKFMDFMFALDKSLGIS